MQGAALKLSSAVAWLAVAQVACPRTELPLDFQAPRVSTISPQTLATNVAITTAVVVTFTEAMRSSSLYDATSSSSDKIILVTSDVDDAFISDFNSLPLSTDRQSRVVSSTIAISADLKKVTLTPTAALQGGTTYAFLVHKDVQDSAGNKLVDDAKQNVAFKATFTTASAVTATPVIPASGATGIAPNLTAVRVAFSPTVQAATVTTSSFRLLRCGPVDGGSTCLDELVTGTTIGPLTDPVSQAEIRPSSQLAINSLYKVSLTETILSTTGTALSPLTYTFSTASAADTTPPVLSAIVASARDTTCTITWTTNESATAAVEYFATDGGATSTATGTSSNAGLTQTVSLTGLAVETDYTFTAISSDAVNNTTRSDAGAFRTIVVPFVLNEVLADPPADGGDANQDGVTETTKDEFIEFVNITDASVDVSSWTLADSVSVRMTFPSGTIVPSRKGLVVFTGGDPARKVLDGGSSCASGLAEFGGGTVCTIQTSSIWNNTGDTVILKNQPGVTIIQEAFGSSSDQSLTRVPELGTTGTLSNHKTAPDAGGRAFSPGTRVDGTAF